MHQCGLSGVAVYSAAGDGTVIAQHGQFQKVLALGRIHTQLPGSGCQFHHRHPVLRQGPRLVRADDAGASQRLNRRHPAHNPALCRHPPDTDGQYNGHNRRKALRNCRNCQTDGDQKHLQRLDMLEQPHQEDHRTDD